MTKIALVTGASSGIGKATAIKLSENEYDLILSGRREEKIEALKNQLSKTVKVITLKNFYHFNLNIKIRKLLVQNTEKQI